MTPAVATRPKLASEGHGFKSATEMREVLERALEALNADGRAGTQLRAAGLNLRLECPDVRGVVQVAASKRPDSYIQWRFDRRGTAKPKLVLTMGSEVANAWLQGRESIPMGIAHRRMKCSGDARDALRYLPVLKLIAEPYRKLVRSDYPHLAL